MPDGPRPNGPNYDDDFYAWTQYQAQVLRELRTHDNRFDRENLAEEIEDLGRSHRDAVRSQFRRILVHFLKLAHSPARDPRADWMDSIDDARAEIEDKLTPTLRRDIDETLPRLYANARKPVVRDLEKYGEHHAAASLPVECPYTIDELLADDFYPAPVSEPENAAGTGEKE
ncbi:MAG TPA: DUF29 domain-containing protein [Stellaceae bacterium]|nr:DUF29 domain-containing protein [Stellaceae bacterium]